MSQLSSRQDSARRPRFRSRVGAWLGIAGDERAKRRFLRFAFLVRFVLLIPTPLFFLLPGQQYSASARGWAIYGLLLAWGLMLALLAWRHDQLLRRARFLHLLDIALVFVAFVAATSAPERTISPSYTEVVLAGSFQLQTYGAVVTSAALAGLTIGLGYGFLSAAAYVLSLAALGGPVADLVSPVQVQSTLARAALYVLAGIAFGLYTALLARLIASEAQVRHIVEEQVAAREAQVATEERLRVLRGLHERGLGKLQAVGQSLEEIRDVSNGAVREALDGVVEFFSSLVRSLTESPPDEQPGSRTITQVLEEVHANHGLKIGLRSHPVELNLEATNVEPDLVLTNDEVHALVEIVSEAISNAKKHAKRGVIRISGAQRSAREYVVVVSDAGPKEQPGIGYHLGHESIDAYTQERGWWWTFEPGSGRRSRSRVVLVVRRPEDDVRPPPMAHLRHWRGSS